MRPLVLAAIALLAASSAAAEDSAPSDPAALRAQVQQELLPGLAARRETAARQASARRAFFAGEAPLAEAFPHLEGARLDDPAVVTGRLLRLDDRGRARALERLAPPPQGLEEREAGRLAAAREDALDAEDEAEALERRLLLTLRAGLERHPALQAEALEAWRVRLRASPPATDAEPDEAVALAAAILDEDRARLEALARALRLRAVVPTAPVPSPDEDLALLQDPERAAEAMARLGLLRPFLDPQARARVDQEELAWIEGQRLPALEAEKAAVIEERERAQSRRGGDAEALAVVKAEAAEALARAQARAEATPEGEGEPLLAARWAVAQAEVALATARHDLAVMRHAQASRPEQVDAGSEADRARREAEAARQRAEAARQQARDVEATRAAELLAVLATAQERATEEWSAAQAQRDALDAAAEAHLAHQEELRATAARLWTRGVLPTERPDPDALYRQIRARVDALRHEARQRAAAQLAVDAAGLELAQDIAADRERLDAERSRVPASPEIHLQREEVFRHWSEALADAERASAERGRLAREARDEVIRSLQEAQALRRRVKPYISRAELRAEREDLFRELYMEATLLAPGLVAAVRERGRDILGIPAALTNFTVVLGFLLGSLRALVLLTVWWFGRGWAPLVAHRLVRRGAAAHPGWRLVEFERLRPGLERLFIAALDLLVGLLLLAPLRAWLPELGLVVYAWIHLAAWRLIQGAFEVAVVRHPEQRPALRAMRGPTYDMTALTLRWVTAWWLTRRLAWHLNVELLGVDAIGGLIDTGFVLAGVAMALVLLHRWEPLVRERLLHSNQELRLVRGLSRGAPAGWQRLRFAWGAAGIGFLAAGAAFEAAWRFGREGSHLGTLLNLIGRYRMVEERKTLPVPLSSEDASRIAAPRCPPEAFVARPVSASALRGALRAWEKEGRRGLVALVGDLGDGKRTLLDRFAEELVTEGRQVVRLRLQERMLERKDMVGWLARGLGAPVDGGVEGLVAALAEGPKRVVLLEQAHLAYLRTVGGFEALRALLFVMNTCGERCFWVTSFHRPSWRYLTRLGDLVNMEVFRAVVEIPPMGEAQLRELALGRLAAIGYEADFSRLVRRNPFGEDPAVELERTTSMFFRLLSEASGGNAAVALHLWVECLVPAAAGVLEVRSAAVLEVGVVEGLTETDLFLLTALRTHDVLSERELVSVTNMAPGTVRSGVRHLQGMGLVRREDDRVRIVVDRLPRVTRTLRRRNFLQGAA